MNLILVQLNVFFMSILILRRDTNVIHLFFVFVSLVLMSHFISLNHIFLILPILTFITLVFFTYPLCLLLLIYFLLRNYFSHQQQAPSLTSSTPSDPPPNLNSLPIALCNGKRTCTSHPIFQFVFYSHTSSLSSIVVPKFVRRLLWKKKCLPCLKMQLGM